MIFHKKKSLGQNFLINKGILEIIAKEAEIKKGEIVVEVGPGSGYLTQSLLEAGAVVFAIEKDNRLIQILKEKFTKKIKNKRLILINDDILKFNFAKLVRSKKYKIVANIPYYITGALFKKIFSQKNLPSLVVLTLQKEVAKRIIVMDGKESILSISVKAYGKPKIVKIVSRGSFSPVPSVDSAILKITDISKNFFKEFPEEKFFSILHAGFSSKRKFLISNLQKIESKEKLEKIFNRLNINKKIRAEDLDLNEWKKLTTMLHDL